MDCTNAREMLSAYADDELDLALAAQVRAHLDACAACRTQLERQKTISAAVRRSATYHRASDTLRARLLKGAPRGGSGETRARVPRAWWTGAIAAALALSVGLNIYLAQPRDDHRLADDIVSGHVRSLREAHLLDVVSTDQHTVRPWFTGKLDYAPPVHDLAADGFPLAGGRLDYIEGRDVAALVYRHGPHTINVFVWPAKNEASADPVSLSNRGYNLIHWNGGGMFWCAVSDMNPTELAAFAQALRAQG